MLVWFACVSCVPTVYPQPIANPEPATALKVLNSFSPPTAPLVQRRSNTALPGVWTASGVPTGLTLYSIGNPSAEEQLYLEMINRARANPVGEASLFSTTADAEVLGAFETFHVNLPLMIAQFAMISAAPPLSLNAQLLASARVHSQDMFDNQFQGHGGSDGSSISSRITAQGYAWTSVAENVFSHAKSVWHGHAAFEVDWGGDASTGGMQSPPGHRQITHNPEFKEVGIGMIKGSNGSVGPQLVTQDFGNRRGITPFITGVAYYDLNGNKFYDPGEAIEGITVQATGSKFYAVTSASGGYSVPVPGNGAFTVSFSAPGVASTERIVTVSNQNNVKVDLVPFYAPPQINGSTQPAVNQNNRYQFTAVGGANGYQWKQNQRVPFTESIGAEAGLDRITSEASLGYDVIDSIVNAAGNFSFHLAHVEPQNQVLTLLRVFRPAPGSHLLFSTALGVASTGQVARAQISSNAGQTWQDVWKEAGNGGLPETRFTAQSVPLDSFAGHEIMLRFRYDVAPGRYYPQADPGAGFYIDEIRFSNAEELLDEVVAATDTTDSFTFRPAQTGLYSLRVRARIADNYLPWGPPALVTAQAAATLSAPRITAIRKVSASQMEIEFESSGSLLGSLLGTALVQSAENINGPWATELNASIVSPLLGTTFRATVSTGSSRQKFYRVVLP